jgi:hypothetical protein
MRIALIDLSPGQLAVQHHRLPYDVERAVHEICARGLPAEFADMLRQSCGLDQIERTR